MQSAKFTLWQSNKVRQRTAARYNVVALAIVMGVLLAPSAVTPQRLPHVSLSSQASLQRANRGASMPSSGFDCVGRPTKKHPNDFIQRSSIGRAEVAQGVEEAYKALRNGNCPRCDKMFVEEAEAVLKRLEKNDAIIVSKFVPTFHFIDEGHVPSRIRDPQKFAVDAIAHYYMPYDPYGDVVGRCIYVNESQFLAKEMAHTLGKDLTLAQARGLAILHEVAHMTFSIQRDSVSPENRNSIAHLEDAKAKNFANTECVKHNCFVCKEFKLCPNPEIRPMRRPRKTFG